MEIQTEAIRQRIQKMSDQELLRYGLATRYMCSPEANLVGPPQEVVFRLEEARKEWRRRHPQLRLSESI